MNTVLKFGGVLVIALVPAFADSMPVAGSGSGTFGPIQSGTLSNGNTVWTYDGVGFGSSILSFTGDNFPGFLDINCGFTTCTTPTTVDLGTLTQFNNYFSNTNQDLTGTLNIDVNFTTPSGQSSLFAYGIGIDESFNRLDSDSVVDLLNFDGPSQSFTVGGETYTVTLDGFYNGLFNLNGPLSYLDTPNIDGTSSASLYATITSAPAIASTPEPTSILLLGSAVFLTAAAARKRRKA